MRDLWGLGTSTTPSISPLGYNTMREKELGSEYIDTHLYIG